MISFFCIIIIFKICCSSFTTFAALVVLNAPINVTSDFMKIFILKTYVADPMTVFISIWDIAKMNICTRLSNKHTHCVSLKINCV